MSRSEILARFEHFGIVPTPQRLAVAAILLHKPQHLSAEQIIEHLSLAGSKVSKATVYNSLNLFAERGLIKECLVDPERRIYDSSTIPHHHFYNVDTGELSDIPTAGIEINGLPELPEGTRCEGVELFIHVRSVAE